MPLEEVKMNMAKSHEIARTGKALKLSADKIVMLPVSEVRPYEKNPRKNENAVKFVKASIEQFGFKVPIIIDSNRVIVCGHTRLMAAKSLGMGEVPCIMADDLTDDQIRAFRLADNKVGEFAEWDMDLLGDELDAIADACDIDMGDFGFDLSEFDNIGMDEKTEVEEDEVPEEVEPVCKKGEIWLLGEHRLMCGDSLNEADVLKLLNGEHAPLTFTDPPYRLATEGGGVLKAANSMKQIKQNGVDQFEPSKLKLYSETNIYSHNKPLIKDYILLAEREGKPYDLAIYKKQGLPNYAGHLMTDLEYIAVIGDQGPKKGLDFETYSKLYIGKKDADNELSYSKPVALCGKFIMLYSDKGDIVLDIFGGSGSTLIACEQLNRKCRMMELDPHYCDVIIARWEKLTGQKAVKIEG